MAEKTIPDIVVGRLPIYLRALQRMLQEGRHVTSSQELGERLGISAAQIRKDLSQFGEFGKQGTGYSIESLAQQVQSILKVDKVWKVVVVGAGDIGSALGRYPGLNDRGFQVRMIFDNSPQKIGTKIDDYVVQDSALMAEAIMNEGIQIAVMAVPASAAQSVADELVKVGIKAILNYAPISINVPSDVKVQYIDPVTHLQRMTYYL